MPLGKSHWNTAVFPIFHMLVNYFHPRRVFTFYQKGNKCSSEGTFSDAVSRDLENKQFWSFPYLGRKTPKKHLILLGLDPALLLPVPSHEKFSQLFHILWHISQRNIRLYVVNFHVPIPLPVSFIFLTSIWNLHTNINCNMVHCQKLHCSLCLSWGSIKWL